MFRALCAALAVVTAPIMALAAEDLPTHLRRGDRIVFYGDSITEQKLYTNYVENYLTLRYPEAGFTFFNAGWSGDNANGGNDRLKRDVLPLNPDVVTICYGMNDGWYMKYTEDTGNYYRKGMNGIIEKLRKKGVRVVLLTPGIVDSEWLTDIGYNDTLRSMSDVLLDIAKTHDLPACDLNALMTRIQKEGKVGNPEFSVVEEEMGIHPRESGQLVMAYALLNALGVPPRHTSVTAHRNDDGTHTFRLPELPFFVEEAARPMLGHLDFQERFNDVRVLFPELENQAYHIDFLKPGTTRVLPRGAITDGIALGSLWESPPVREAQIVHNFTRDKNEVYYRFWRSLGMKGTWWIQAPINRDVHRAGIDASLVLEKARRADAVPNRTGYRVRMTPIPSAREEIANGHFIRWWSRRGPAGNDKSPAIADEAGFTVEPRKLDDGWGTILLDTGNPGNSLGARLGKPRNSHTYLYTVIDSPKEQNATVLVGNDDGYVLYVNGRKVGESSVTRRAEPDQDRFENVALARGSNVLMAKVLNAGDEYGFVLRFADLSEPVGSTPPTLEKAVPGR